MKKRQSSKFLDAVEYFTEVYIIDSKGNSSNTQESYKSCYRRLLEFMYKKKKVSADKITFKMLDLKTVTEFFDWLSEERGCADTTLAQRHAALSSFSEFAQNWEYEDAYVFRNTMLKIPEKKARSQARTFFNEKEIKILLEMPDISTEIGKRDRTILRVMYATGVRAQELCSLKVKNVELYSGYVVITVLGKGRKTRRLKIAGAGADELISYIKHRGIEKKPEAHVFSSQRSEKMSVSCLEDIYEKYVCKARMNNPDLFQASGYTCHNMRHTTACHMLAAGCTLIFIKDFLGHNSISTTLIYAEMMKSTTDKALEKWSKKQFELYSQIVEEKKKTDSLKENIPDFLKYKGNSNLCINE